MTVQRSYRDAIFHKGAEGLIGALNNGDTKRHHTSQRQPNQLEMGSDNEI